MNFFASPEFEETSGKLQRTEKVFHVTPDVNISKTFF